MLSFNVFGIPTKVHWMFWVVCALLGGVLQPGMTPRMYQGVLVWVGVCFVSIMWHELGHALTARRFGARPEILLYGMGGLASYPGNVRITRKQRMLIIAGGPGFGLALGGLVWLLAKSVLPPAHQMSYHLWVLVESLIHINIFWSLINMLPVLPLDGGQFLGAWMRENRARLCGQVGTGVAAAVAFIAFSSGQPYLGIMFCFLAFTNYQIAQGQRVKFF